jgi:2-oxoglutarate dehydrogenase E1 component
MRANVAAQLDPVYLESLYEEWQQDPDSLDPTWQAFFQGFSLASCPRKCVAAGQAQKQSNVASLIYNYRDQGHRLAHNNPLFFPPSDIDELSLEYFQLSNADLDEVFDTGHLGFKQRATLREIVKFLEDTYCGSVGAEYLHIQDVSIRRWLQDQMEKSQNRPSLKGEEKRLILENLIDAALFETFVHRRFVGHKRFSIEGAESLISALHWLVDISPQLGVDEVVIGMAHRGRINVLANLLDKPYQTIFSEFKDNYLLDSMHGSGDVKYHKGFSSDHDSHRDGQRVHLSLTANPSHLEVVGPVALGKARAKQRRDPERQKVLPLVVHGDSAFAGQGIVAETFNMSRLKGYSVGGTIHLIVNNQIGFTTGPDQARSAGYATDVAKMVEAPIFHVNGDDPEAVVFVSELALRFRQTFGRDVVIDMLCYRRHGHSEVDEPRLTQPLLSRQIAGHTPVHHIYSQKLVKEGVLSADEVSQLEDGVRTTLDEAFVAAQIPKPAPEPDSYHGKWVGFDYPYSADPVDTSVARSVLEHVSERLRAVPENFSLNSKVKRILGQRNLEAPVDWSYGEALAFGTLLLEGTPVRLSGQDSERGTFSQRHAVLSDVNTVEHHVPLNHLAEDQARFCVYNSPLSEASVLAFEYGYSLADPGMLVLWEAQFGDFANGAQVIVDQFIVAAHAKWKRSNNLVMLLPHGYEGQGPEHSNAYLDRYLAACAEENIQVCVPTTPAQYFHVLRRQMHRPFRLPLVLMTPKGLLRHPLATSTLDDLAHGRFMEVLDDPKPPQRAGRVVFCSGRVYYDILEAKERIGVHDVALVRVEQLYPFPKEQIERIVEFYEEVDVIWAQEEPANRGGWTYFEPQFRSVLPHRRLRYVGRPPSASPAVGSMALHRQEQRRLVEQALGINKIQRGRQ